MNCYDPNEQYFDVGNKLIGIVWGKNGDKAVQVIIQKDENGAFVVVGIKEIIKEDVYPQEKQQPQED